MVKNLLNRPLILIQMTDFIGIIQKDTKIQNEISNIIDEYNNQSFATRSKLGENAFIQSSVYKEVINIMGDTINDMDMEIEQKDNKISFLENKIGVTDDKVIEEMNRLDLNEISNNEKNNRIMNRLNNTLNKHNYIKN